MIEAIGLGFKFFFIQILLFLYLYSIPLKGLPQGIGTRVLFSIFGMLILLYGLFTYRIRFNFRQVKTAFFLVNCSILVFVAIIYTSCFINNTKDISMVRNSISFFLTMLSVLFFYKLIVFYFKTNAINALINLIIFGAVIQVLTALIMFINPAVKEYIVAFLDPKDFLIEQLMSGETYRLTGLGTNPFVTGITNGFALILISYKIKTNRKNDLMNLIYILCFILITIIGSMIARTTILGAILALVNLALGFNLNMKISIDKVTKKLVSILAFTLVLGLCVYSIDNEFINKLTDSLEYGFEIIYNLKSGRGAQTESTNELKEMYVWPSKLTTYMIGDGYMNNPDSPSAYYMATDVGYLRLIYYVGLLGLFSFLTIQLLPLFFIYWHSKERYMKQLCILLGIFILILYTKGIADLFFMSFLILFFHINKNHENQHQK
jgi:hypothetical protein